MARLDSFNESAAWRRSLTGTLADVVARGESAPRTLPRTEPKRTILQELGERPERLGPPAIESEEPPK